MYAILKNSDFKNAIFFKSDLKKKKIAPIKTTIPNRPEPLWFYVAFGTR
jgi:hypothetical protein